VTTTPHVRLDEPDHRAEHRYPAVHTCCCRGSAPARTVTREQVDLAVVQLRERRSLAAAEQMLAVLRALDLAVAPANEHRP